MYQRVMLLSIMYMQLTKANKTLAMTTKDIKQESAVDETVCAVKKALTKSRCFQ